MAGEVLSAGPDRFVGYLDSRLNADAFDAAGFFRTGDIGILDARGRLRIIDRKKDIVIRGGENISSREVEEILCRHPDVVEAAVIGVPDARYGERVGACLRVRFGRKINLDSLRAHFAELGVARQKTPEHLFIFDDFPRTPTGKILKTALRKLTAKA
jgi:non-ribosomal peptide synthetase component E (peptide arylation enzyme)